MACMRRIRILTLLTVAVTPSACTHGLFSSANPGADRSRPVVRIETRGGVEYGVTTTDGILFLGRTATEGPCRVHLFLGATPTPMIEDGTIETAGSVFYRVDFDLKTMAVPLLERDLEPGDALVAIPFTGPFATSEVPVRLAQNSSIEGDVIEWPGRDLAVGTGVFVRQQGQLMCAGMVAANLELQGTRYIALAGSSSIRSLLATPRPYPAREQIKFRGDDISVIKRR